MKLYAIYKKEYDADHDEWWLIDEDYIYLDENNAKNKLTELTQNQPNDYRLEELETKDDDINIKMGYQHDWQEININNELHLHITAGDDGYAIDCYKYYPKETEHEFNDDDFLTSTCVEYSELGNKDLEVNNDR